MISLGAECLNGGRALTSLAAPQQRASRHRHKALALGQTNRPAPPLHEPHVLARLGAELDHWRLVSRRSG